MTRKSALSLWAAILVLSSANVQAAAYRQSPDEGSWQVGRSVLAADPDNPRQPEAEMSPYMSGPASSPVLPHGADALKETYGDWGVECRIVQLTKRCSLGQFQYNEEQHTLMFSIEIFPPEDGDYAVAITMPFGLNLADGIRLKLDEQSIEQRGSFGTCLPTGCLVPVKLTSSSIEAMKTAKALMVIATAFSGGQHPSFRVSLKGFSAAIERLEDLQQ